MSIVSGETTISAISSTEILALKKDYVISGTGIPEGTTITEVGEDYVTISQAATASATESISYGNINNFPFLYGKGDGTSTFVLPDYRGRFIMGGSLGLSCVGWQSGNFYRESLDASRSSDVYGNSETVQPPAFALVPQIKY